MLLFLVRTDKHNKTNQFFSKFVPKLAVMATRCMIPPGFHGEASVHLSCCRGVQRCGECCPGWFGAAFDRTCEQQQLVSVQQSACLSVGFCICSHANQNFPVEKNRLVDGRVVVLSWSADSVTAPLERIALKCFPYFPQKLVKMCNLVTCAHLQLPLKMAVA